MLKQVWEYHSNKRGNNLPSCTLCPLLQVVNIFSDTCFPSPGILFPSLCLYQHIR